MTMAIKQHWVPRFYLRGFTTSKNGETIWVTKIEQTYAGNYTALKASISDVAHHSHLYSLPSDDGTFRPEDATENGWNDIVDKALQTLEARAGHVWGKLKSLDRTLNLLPGSEGRSIVASFLASLHLRNPRMVAVAKFAATRPPEALDVQTLDEFYGGVAGMPVDLSPTLEGVHDRLDFLEIQIGELEGVKALLLDMHWTVRYFDGKKAAGPLVTTDTPIFFVNRLTMEPSKLDSPDCAVYCPLTSRVLLIATRAKTDIEDGKISDGTEDGASFINRFIVHYGQQEAYSGFELKEDFPFLRDDPEAGS